jgi:heat shock protein HspQ
MNQNEIWSGPMFEIGTIVHHKRFGYRGVIVDAHQHFEGTEEWYSRVARSRPPRNRPWYQVLVHNASIETYVSERQLEVAECKEPINHPYVPVFFNEFEDGIYSVGGMVN